MLDFSKFEVKYQFLADCSDRPVKRHIQSDNNLHRAANKVNFKDPNRSHFCKISYPKSNLKSNGNRRIETILNSVRPRGW